MAASIDTVIAILGIAGLVAVFLVARAARHAGTARRIRQLDDAAELLRQHADALEQVLADHEAPTDLKVLLLRFSDLMADRDAVNDFGQWLSDRPISSPLDSDETRAIDATLSRLVATRPDLAEAFVGGVLTALFGAFLRWPESAAVLDRVGPSVVATRCRGVGVAVTAMSFRGRSGAILGTANAAPTQAGATA